MCGLLTFVSARGAAYRHRDAVAAALESIHHRGPDETNVSVIGDDVVFGCKRLAVVDVSHSGQPLTYPADGYDAGRYAIVFNGEIYNYIELRDELMSTCGARFATDGDTEVIAAAYHYWGEQAVTRLRGMFAIVIFDTHRGIVWGARDPYGIKPLYYLTTDDGIYFASEKKALLPFMGEEGPSAEIDEAALSHYVSLQYVPEPATLHKGIGRVGSGESFSYLPTGTFATRRYHQPEFRPAPADDPQALFGRIRTTLRESVRMHLRADVPVGCLISGGIDSIALAAMAREFNPEITAFTAGYDINGYSEIDLAEAAGRDLGIRVVSTTIRPADLIAALPKIIWHLDDPVADPSLATFYFVARTAAQHVTAVLSGEGADELFGGYPIYREPLSLSSVSGLPPQVQRGLRKVAGRIPQGIKGKSFLERGTTPIEERYSGHARTFTEEDKQRLLVRHDPGVRHTAVTAPVYAEAADLDDVAKMQYIDLFTWLRGDILVKADRMTMAHSLELRTPYLDKEVFEVASTIPLELKLPAKSDATKHALRQALSGVVPACVVKRRAQGSPAPTRLWLRSELYEWVRGVLSRSGAGDLINLGYAVELLDAHKRGEADNSRKVWTVLTFCLWHAIFIERSLDPGGSAGLPASRSHAGTAPAGSPPVSPAGPADPAAAQALGSVVA